MFGLYEINIHVLTHTYLQLQNVNLHISIQAFILRYNLDRQIHPTYLTFSIESSRNHNARWTLNVKHIMIKFINIETFFWAQSFILAHKYPKVQIRALYKDTTRISPHIQNGCHFSKWPMKICFLHICFTMIAIIMKLLISIMFWGSRNPKNDNSNP